MNKKVLSLTFCISICSGLKTMFDINLSNEPSLKTVESKDGVYTVFYPDYLYELYYTFSPRQKNTEYDKKYPLIIKNNKLATEQMVWLEHGRIGEKNIFFRSSTVFIAQKDLLEERVVIHDVAKDIKYTIFHKIKSTSSGYFSPDGWLTSEIGAWAVNQKGTQAALALRAYEYPSHRIALFDFEGNKIIKEFDHYRFEGAFELEFSKDDKEIIGKSHSRFQSCYDDGPTYSLYALNLEKNVVERLN